MLQRAADAQQRASEGGPSISRATDVRWDRPGEVLRFLSGGFGEAAHPHLKRQEQWQWVLELVD